MRTPRLRLLGVLLLVCYALIWMPILRYFYFSEPAAFPDGISVYVYGAMYLLTLALFSASGYLVGKKKRRPTAGLMIGVATGVLVLSPPFYYWVAVASLYAALAHL